MKRPVLSDPKIELLTDDEQAQHARTALLLADENTRAQVLRDLDGRLAQAYQAPRRAGSDRWVYVTDHVVYKIPSPDSYGAGLAGIFASLGEAKAAEHEGSDMAQMRLCHTPEGVPVVVMERVSIPGPELPGDDALGRTADGRTVRFDHEGLGR